MKKRFILFIKYYLPALIWAGVIFYFSSVPNLQVAMYSTTEEIILRKGAHFVEFAILAFFVWRIFYVGHKFQARYAFFWALILAGLYGASDEFHQTFVLGRTGKVIDAFYDAASVLFTLEMLVIAAKRKLQWKNFTILFLAVVALFGLELKMLSETKSFKVSFAQMKTDLGYMVEHEINFILGKKPVINKTDENNKSNTENVNSTNDTKLSDQIKESISKNPPIGKNNMTAVKQVKEPLPDKITLDVPFTSQAPRGVWDTLHEESCEEASVLMVEYYMTKKTLTPSTAEKEIQAMVKFEVKKYGDYKDTDAAETLKLAQDFYELKNLKVVYDFSKDDLKKYLAKGQPIIVPAAGRLLKNPHFTPPGPLYHNLVLTGYNGDQIITNDPGTKHGEGYTYDINTLYSAIHDFPGKLSDIEQGRKAMIVVE